MVENLENFLSALLNTQFEKATMRCYSFHSPKKNKFCYLTNYSEELCWTIARPLVKMHTANNALSYCIETQAEPTLYYGLS